MDSRDFQAAILEAAMLDDEEQLLDRMQNGVETTQRAMDSLTSQAVVGDVTLLQDDAQELCLFLVLVGRFIQMAAEMMEEDVNREVQMKTLLDDAEHVLKRTKRPTGPLRSLFDENGRLRS